MAGLPATEASVTRSNELLTQLRRDARARGLLAPAGAVHLARCLTLGPLLAGLLGVAWTTPSTGVWLLAAACAAVTAVQIGFTAHDAGHRAVSRSATLNQVAGHFAFSIVNGLGFQSWCISHDDHHRFCQDESKDPDMQVETLMSLTPNSAAAKTGIGRQLLHYQGYILWPLSTLFAHSLRLQSLARVYARPIRLPWDALLLPLHYVAWWLVPWWLLGVSAGHIAAVYLWVSALMGVYLALLFWLNHVGMPALKDGHSYSTLEQQVVTSRNLRTPPALDFVFGGLNLQIEHHLLPGCPSHQLRRTQSLTKPLCRTGSLPYREETPWEAIGSVTRHVFHLGTSARRH